MKRSRSDRQDSLVSLTGWLFADLLLALTLVALGTAVVMPTHHPRLAPTSTVATPATGSGHHPATKARPSPPSLERRAVTFSVSLSSARVLSNEPNAIRHLRTALHRKLHRYAERKAGMVLAFGHDADPGRGEALSSAATRELRRLSPSMFGKTVMKPYHELSGANEVTLQIYFFTERHRSARQ